MAVDEALSAQMRNALSDQTGISETTMMGARAFLLNGHMVSTARRDTDGTALFMFRVGLDQMQDMLSDPRLFPARMGKRVMAGFLRCAAETCDTDTLRSYLARAIDHVSRLPPKPEAAG